MKANELMIGDWVRNDFGENQQIVEIRQDCVMLAYNDTFSLGKIEPIPLTAEILEKNGFEDSEFFCELLYNDWQIMSDCHHLAARCWDGWILDIPCKFVHQLQHALHLCEIDKTIEL